MWRSLRAALSTGGFRGRPRGLGGQRPPPPFRSLKQSSTARFASLTRFCFTANDHVFATRHYFPYFGLETSQKCGCCQHSNRPIYSWISGHFAGWGRNETKHRDEEKSREGKGGGKKEEKGDWKIERRKNIGEGKEHGRPQGGGASPLEML